LASSPLFWFYGEIALPHTVDTFLVITSVWWLYETMRGDRRFLFPAVIILAIAGGVRPQTLVFLAPLTLFAFRGVGWKNFVLAGIVGAIVCLMWFIPLTMLNGGVSRYLEIMDKFGTRFQTNTSIFAGAGWAGVQHNVLKIVPYTLYGWSVALVPAMLYGGQLIYRRNWPHTWEKVGFLLLWITPSLLFYVFIHMGQQGLVFVYLPALILVSAAALVRLLDARPNLLAAAAAVIVVFNTGIFILLPEYPLAPIQQRFLTRDTLRNNDLYYQSRFDAIRDNFSPANTAILAGDWHHAGYYLPDYTIVAVDGRIQRNNETIKYIPGDLMLSPDFLELQVAGTQATLLLFDQELAHLGEPVLTAHGLVSLPITQMIFSNDMPLVFNRNFANIQLTH
jgi:hypothetical protein